MVPLIIYSDQKFLKRENAALIIVISYKYPPLQPLTDNKYFRRQAIKFLFEPIL